MLLFTSCDLKSSLDYYNLAVTLSEQGKNKEAIEMLNKAISKDPKFIKAYINRGAYKSDLGCYEDAIKDYKEVVKINPKNILALVNIGCNYKRLKDNKMAIKYFNKALELKGDGPLYLSFSPNFMDNSENYDVPAHEIFYERGIAFYSIDSLEQAYYDFKTAINNNYMIADCYCRIGYIYLSTRNNELAKDFFRKSKQLGDRIAEDELRKRFNE